MELTDELNKICREVGICKASSKTEGTLAQLKPMSPEQGPPLPRGWNYTGHGTARM